MKHVFLVLTILITYSSNSYAAQAVVEGTVSNFIAYTPDGCAVTLEIDSSSPSIPGSSCPRRIGTNTSNDTNKTICSALLTAFSMQKTITAGYEDSNCGCHCNVSWVNVQN
jgi:hypothetical protein